MKIVSKFTTGIVSKLAEVALRKKLGVDADITLNEVQVTVVDGKTHIHLNLDAELGKEELTKILKNIGI
nr:MAG TPA: hypothetical protein [Caudoviricetes sp.]